MKITIDYHGMMLTDYFSGTSGVMLPIHITPETKNSEVIQELRDDVNILWDYIEGTAHQKGFTGDLEKEIEAEIQKMEDFCNGNNALNDPCFPNMEYDHGEDVENAVMIFSIEWKEN